MTQTYLDMIDFDREVPEVGDRLRRVIAIGKNSVAAIPLESALFKETDGSPMNSLRQDFGTCLIGLTSLIIRQAETVVLLLDNCFADQALTLNRTLYEAVVNLRTISIDKSYKTAQQFIDHQASCNDRVRRSLNDDSVAKPIADLIAADKVMSATIDQDIASYKATYPDMPQDRWHKEDFVTRAQKCRLGLRAYYQWLCQFTHAGTNAVRHLYKEDSGVYNFSPAQRHGFTPFFTLFCLCSALETAFFSLDWQDSELEDTILWIAIPGG